MRKRKPLIIFAVIIIAAAVGAAGFFAGKTYSERGYNAERDLDVLVRRSGFDGLGGIDGEIYVVGHKNPDTDSVCSAIAEMERIAKADGCCESVLYVWDQNPEGYNLYQKCGYVAIEHEEGGTYMKKDL
ncbi:MAG: hypothetical protein IJT70_04860 [Clostridia bacterium]|nr:hypothetical protein [Clostridia bacterium]